MKVLITGGTGYLGSRIAEYFANNTRNFITLGTRKSINCVKWLPQARVVKTIWSSSSELEENCKDIDVIIHLAGMNSIDCLNNPLSALKVNGLSTAQLLNTAIKQNVKRFIYLSTAHVYEKPLAGKITEKSLANNLHPYASSHKAGEDSVLFAHSNGNIDGIVVRLTNAFGSPLNSKANCWTLVTNDLSKQSIKSSKMIINSSEMQRRDFISINNVCRAIEHLIKIPSNNLDNGLFNVGGEWTPTILEIAKIIAERSNFLLDKEIRIETPNLINKSKPLDLNYDISKLKSTGFILIDDRKKEFDDLIYSCNSWFGA